MHQLNFSTPRRGAFTFAQVVLALVIVMGLAAIIFPIFGRAPHSHGRGSCQSNLKQIMLGIKQYTQDYDEKYPLRQYGADRSTGWATAIQPYLKSSQIYQCPQEDTAFNADPSSDGYCDYFYNSNIGSQKGGKREDQIDNSSLTIMLGDGAPSYSGSSSHGGTISSMGFDGTKGGLAVAQGQWNPAESGSRHKSGEVGGGNYAFADGHVKWLTPSRVTRNPISFKNPTFRLTIKNPPVSGS